MQKRGLGFLLIVLLLVVVSALISTGTTRKIPVVADLFETKPQMGLDIRGGFRFTIRADLEGQSKLDDIEAAEIVRILENRAQQALGVSEATVSRRGDSRFVVELPGFTDESEARRVMKTSARLEWYWPRNVATDKQPLRQYVSSESIPWEPGRSVRHVPSRREGFIQQTISATEFVVNFGKKDDPKLETHQKKDLELVAKDTEPSETVFRRRNSDEDLVPGTPEFKAMMEGWQLLTGGENLKSSQPLLEPGASFYSIGLTFTAQGTQDMNAFARRVMNNREYIAAVLDDEVVSFAVLLDGVLFDRGEARITGSFSAEEAKNITTLLNTGALKYDLVEENATRISPVQGDDALQQIIFAGLISFAVIALFLLVYYLFPGLVALLALCAYTLFCYAVFLQLHVTFSLAGIAGFILSVGMAVDANILIFERLKEELRSGKSLNAAIDLGFRRAFPAILDSNACTVITSLVLYNFGSGPVRGFATTLIIGVLISLFTAVTVTRSLLQFLVSSGIGRNEKLYGMSRSWFGEHLEETANERPLNIVGKMGRYFLISGLIILPGLVFLGLGGLKPNVEFLNGVEAQILLPPGSPTTPSVLDQKLSDAGLKGGNVKVSPPDPKLGAENQYIAWVTLPKDENPQLKALVDSEDNAKKFEGRQMILRAVGADTTPVTKDGTTEISGLKGELNFESTSPAVRAETIQGAIYGIIVSALLITVYLALRFGVAVGGFVKGFRFGMSAIMAMLHDVFVILGLAALMGKLANWEISSLTITAMLTVIGFSVHDTIVIFDRIRENLRRPLHGESFENLVNRSITQSLARSLNTSGTVIITLGLLATVGSATPDLRHFNVAMLVGIVTGTYSSIFNAAPILVIWERVVAKRKGLSATLMHDERLRGGGEDEKPDDDDPTVYRGPEMPPGGGSGQFSPTRRKRP